jgi:hypothetical protein
MIPVPSGVRVWSRWATDMRRGMNGLAIQVQEPAAGPTAATCSSFAASAAT